MPVDTLLNIGDVSRMTTTYGALGGPVVERAVDADRPVSECTHRAAGGRPDG